MRQGLGEPEARGERVEVVAAPVLEAHGLSLVDLDFKREGRRWVLRMFVDKVGGVTIADCQRFSHEVGDVLDASGWFDEPYDLEVSSPGLDRELRKEREWRWAVGRDMRCWVREPVDGRTELSGRLVEVTAEALTMVGPAGEPMLVPRRLVTKARLVPELWPGRRM
jgi:ribosome maturation factor RimP